MSANTAEAPLPRRQQLLGIAGQMFARQGFAGTGVYEIGEAAGVTGPALYRYFANKQAILDALIVESMERLLKSVQGIASDPEPELWLDKLIDVRMDFSFGPDRYAFIVRRNEQDTISKGALRKLAAMEEVYWAEWLRVMAALRPGVSTTVLRRAIYAVHVFIGYLALEEHLDDIDDVRAHMAAMVRAALFAEPAGPRRKTADPAPRKPARAKAAPRKNARASGTRSR
jgi:AcrR family transcriptional regulator